MPFLDIVASPSERFNLTIILLQLDEVRRPVLQLRNGLEGRSLRSFMRGLGLEPIRRALAKSGNTVSTKMAMNDELRRFHVSPDAIAFFRERIADLPRTAAHECVVGELLDSLHGIGPGRFGRDIPEGEEILPYDPEGETWEPPVHAAELEMSSISATDLQRTIDAYELELEQLPETLDKTAVVASVEGFIERVSALLTVPG